MTPRELAAPLEGETRITALVYEASLPRVGATLILGHGAGAGQRSPFMTDFAIALAARGLDTATFDFPYTEARRRLPDRRPVLEASYRAVIETVPRNILNPYLFVGGKSMGGRIATHVAAEDSELAIDGIVLLGYPLHPPNRPAERRDAHLRAVGRPMLFVQGSRDGFGSPFELAPLLASLSAPATLYEIERGDHSFKVGRLGAPEQAEIYDDAQREIAEWIQRTIDRLSDAR